MLCLVIGYGNPLRGDDGLGFVVAQGLAGMIHDEDVKVLALHQLHPEIALNVSTACFVVFIDARSGIPAGAIDIGPVYPDTAAPLTFSHHLPPGVLLACAKALHGTCPEACLVTMTGESFEFGKGLSDTVKERIPGLMDQVMAIVKDAKNKTSPPIASNRVRGDVVEKP